MTSPPRINAEQDLDAGKQALIRLDPRFDAIQGPVELRRRPGGLPGLAWIITGQMISTTAADRIWERTRPLLDTLPLSEIALRNAGQSRAKTAAILAAANALADGSLDLEHVATLPDDQAMAALLHLRGVGRWTAAMYLLACEGRPDVWPAGDVALRRAAVDAFNLDPSIDDTSLTTLADSWRPWRAVAARMLWAHVRTISTKPGPVQSKKVVRRTPCAP